MRSVLSDGSAEGIEGSKIATVTVPVLAAGAVRMGPPLSRCYVPPHNRDGVLGNAAHDSEVAAGTRAEIAERVHASDGQELVGRIDRRLHLQPRTLEVHKFQRFRIQKPRFPGRSILVVEHARAFERDGIVEEARIATL